MLRKVKFGRIDEVYFFFYRISKINKKKGEGLETKLEVDEKNIK